jgi:hypothetical protein
VLYGRLLKEHATLLADGIEVAGGIGGLRYRPRTSRVRVIPDLCTPTHALAPNEFVPLNTTQEPAGAFAAIGKVDPLLVTGKRTGGHVQSPGLPSIARRQCVNHSPRGLAKSPSTGRTFVESAGGSRFGGC